MKKLTLSQTQFNFYVHDLCQQLASSNWRPDYVVGITRGGLIPALMISHYFKIPMKTLSISLRDNVETESNLDMAEEAIGHSNNAKNILIVDDINDTGSTINWLLKDWPSSCLSKDKKWQDVWNNNVRFAVVVDNLSSDCNVKMDYCSLEIDKAQEDIWIEFPYEIWWKQ